MIYAYFRQLANHIGLSEQQQMVLSFSLKRQMDIDKEVVEYSAKNLSTCFLSKRVAVYVAKCGVFINKNSKIEEIFPLLNDLREIEQSKELRVGRPRGSYSKSKFDRYQLDIIELLRDGYNVSAIARKLNVSRSSLKDYIQSRNIKSISKGSWIEIDKSDNLNDSDDTIIICPFDKENSKNNKREERM
ncbi:MAG: helix-turn-helix domain-containing protein [Sulfurovaceae bacterium]